MTFWDFASAHPFAAVVLVVLGVPSNLIVASAVLFALLKPAPSERIK